MGSSFDAPLPAIPLSGDEWVIRENWVLRIYQAEKDNRIRQVAQFDRQDLDEKGYLRELPNDLADRWNGQRSFYSIEAQIYFASSQIYLVGWRIYLVRSQPNKINLAKHD